MMLIINSSSFSHKSLLEYAHICKHSKSDHYHQEGLYASLDSSLIDNRTSHSIIPIHTSPPSPITNKSSAIGYHWIQPPVLLDNWLDEAKEPMDRSYDQSREVDLSLVVLVGNWQYTEASESQFAPHNHFWFEQIGNIFAWISTLIMNKRFDSHRNTHMNQLSFQPFLLLLHSLQSVLRSLLHHSYPRYPSMHLECLQSRNKLTLTRYSHIWLFNVIIHMNQTCVLSLQSLKTHLQLIVSEGFDYSEFDLPIHLGDLSFILLFYSHLLWIEVQPYHINTTHHSYPPFHNKWFYWLLICFITTDQDNSLLPQTTWFPWNPMKSLFQTIPHIQY